MNRWKRARAEAVEIRDDERGPVRPVELRGDSDLFSKLPALYRERPGVLEGIIDVAEELLGETRRRLHEQEERFADPARPALAGTWFGLFDTNRSDDTPANLSGLMSWLGNLAQPRGRDLAQSQGRDIAQSQGRESIAEPPRVWSGFVAVPLEGVHIELRRTRRSCVVLAWSRETLTALPAGFSIPSRFIPVGVSLQVVRFSKLASGGAPPEGARLSGEVVWSGGAPVE